MREERYLACATCDDAIPLVGNGATPEMISNFFDIHTHQKHGDRHILVCVGHEFIYPEHQCEQCGHVA
jgi:hypothetical protein